MFCSIPVEVGNQTLAAECAASYLLFYPTDEPMLEKMKQYRTEVGEDTAVTAREVVTAPGLYWPSLSHTTGSQSRRQTGKRVSLQMCAKPRAEGTGVPSGSLRDRTGLA